MIQRRIFHKYYHQFFHILLHKHCTLAQYNLLRIFLYKSQLNQTQNHRLLSKCLPLDILKSFHYFHHISNNWPVEIYHVPHNCNLIVHYFSMLCKANPLLNCKSQLSKFGKSNSFKITTLHLQGSICQILSSKIQPNYNKRI